MTKNYNKRDEENKTSLEEENVLDSLESEIVEDDKGEKEEKDDLKGDEELNLKKNEGFDHGKGKEALAKEVMLLKEQLMRVQADYQNFKMRVERDKDDMMFFLKSDILRKILPYIDDMERIIKNTKQEERIWTLYEALVAMEKNFKKDLEKLWVKSFESIWCEVDPDRHEVMTQVSSETPWIIVDEFEKWYMLGDRVLRVAKVVVWS